MRVNKYITDLGIEALLEQCNNSIICAVENIKRVCGEKCNWRFYGKRMENFLKEHYNSPDTEFKKELIEILRKEFNYDR